MNQLHVLMVPSWYPTPSAPVSGIFFYEQAKVLHQAGVRVGVVYPDLRSLRTLAHGKLGANRFQVSYRDEEGITTLRRHGWAPPKLILWHTRLWVRSALALARQYVARHGRPQLIHAHGARLAGISGHAIGKALGLPYVLTEHASGFARGDVRAWERARIQAAFEGAIEVMAVSPAMAETVQPYLGERSVTIVPNLANTTFFDLPPAARQAQPFRFLAVSTLTPNKAVHVLVRAFAEAFRGRNDVLLEIGGHGPERAMLTRLAADLGVRDQVCFLGALSRPQVREAMWRAHRFVSTSSWESFSVVLVEALGTGLRVIATRSGGPESIVTSDALGRLVPVDRPDVLASVLREELAKGVLSAAQEAAVHDDVDRRFGPAAFSDRLCERYRAAIRGPS